METERHDHDLGLAHDLSTLLGRRRALTLLAGAGVATLVGCGSSGSKAAATTSSTAAGSSSTTATTVGSTVSSDPIPSETAGPFPGDGSNGPNVLTESGIVRSDITSSFRSSTTVAAGVPTTITLKITDAAKGTPYAGAAVYIWHCDREGRYSMYSSGVTDENYLRGVQEADAGGNVTFTTVYPGAYSGRWPHVHYEVYPSLKEATSAGSPAATSQLALPEATSNLVYAAAGYEESVGNMSRTSLSSDMVFRDGAERETPSASGDVASGITLRLTVPV